MCTDACEAAAGNGEAEGENQVCVALEREVHVRTDLVKNTTTDPRKQVARSGPARCADPAEFTQTVNKKE